MKLALPLCILFLSSYYSFSQSSEANTFGLALGYQFTHENLNKNEEYLYESCGHCLVKQSLDADNLSIRQVYIQGNFYRQKFLIYAGAGFSSWKHELNGSKNYTFSQPQNPSSSSINNRYSIFYSGTANYLNFSVGFGFDLFPAKEKISLFPTVQLSSEILVQRNSDFEYVTITYDDNTTEMHEYSSVEDYYTFEAKNSVSLSPSIGLYSEFRVSERVFWHLKFNCAARTSRFSFDEIHANKLSLSGGVGVNYVF
ncbi:MAG: hypothetical protein AB8B56_05380 [Crocinitomicaceae bacterium]